MTFLWTLAAMGCIIAAIAGFVIVTFGAVELISGLINGFADRPPAYGIAALLGGWIVLSFGVSMLMEVLL